MPPVVNVVLTPAMADIAIDLFKPLVAECDETYKESAAAFLSWLMQERARLAVIESAQQE